jgi:hypothetical protein
MQCNCLGDIFNEFINVAISFPIKLTECDTLLKLFFEDSLDQSTTKILASSLKVNQNYFFKLRVTRVLIKYFF